MNTKKDIGFVLVKMENNPFYDMVVNCIHSFIKNHPDNQYVIFNSFCEKIDTGIIPILHVSQSKFFYGDLFLFDFISLILTKNSPNINQKYFYAQDLPWESSPQTPYNNISKFLIDDNTNIIAKNKYIFDIYDICWKKPIGTSENFDYESLKKIL
jgi:hypothetical protein